MRRSFALAVALLSSGTAALAQEEWEKHPDRISPAARETVQAVRDRLEDITLLNLLNGLYLSETQSARVIELARRAGRIRDEAIRRHERTLEEFREALGTLRERLYSCKSVPAEVEARAVRKEQEIKEIQKEAVGRICALEKELRRVLSAAQIRVIETFNPCLIPPKELKDPVRAGQAEGDAADIEDLLETLRAISDRGFPRLSEAIADLVVFFQEAHLGKMEAIQRAAEIARLRGLFRQVREMPEADFAVEKAALAAKVMRPFHAFQDKLQELTRFWLRFSGGLTKVGKYLLNPRIVPLLERKRAHDCRIRPVDLDKVEPAESCGTCGRSPRRAGRRRAAPHPGAEPRFSDLAAWLQLDEAQADRFRKIVSRAQLELLEVLAAPRGDGRNMVRELFQCLTAGKGEKLMAVLSTHVPDGKGTYLSRIGAIKARADRRFHDVLKNDQERRWRESKIDLFKIKARR